MNNIPYGYCYCGCGRKTRIATNTHRENGHIRGEPVRFLRGHHNRKEGPDYEPEDRGHPTECWIWQRSKTSSEGYGQMGMKPHRGKLAHRHFYEKAYGPIPNGYQIHHRCGQPSCVRPEHLEAVTPAANTRMRGGNKGRTVCPCCKGTGFAD